MKPNQWRRGSRRFLIAEVLLQGKTPSQAFSELRSHVVAQSRPFIFTENPPRGSGEHRRPKTVAAQLQDLRNEINRVYAILTDSKPVRREIPTPTPEPTPEPEIERKPKASGKTKISDAKAFFLSEVRRIRQWCLSREMAGEKIDHISMRPLQAASKLIPAGIPPEALLHSMTIHWPQQARTDAGISSFDVPALSRKIANERGIETVTRKSGKTEIAHEMFGYALVLAENRQPIMAVGPAGTGKSHLATQLADFLELPYGETPMTPGATRGDLLGRHTIRDFIPSAFAQIYAGGGVFNFEEIDASDPSMLIVLNNALAQSHLYNSVDGEVYERHENFIAFSTANTWGLGATREYTGRDKLDAATIDRWRMGRIYLGIDAKLEEALLSS